MKSFFGLITSLSMRFRVITLVTSVLIAGLGLFGMTQLQLELIPSIEFPQTVILAQVSGMSSDEVLNIITLPIEDELSAINEINNVETTTTGAFGAIIVARNEFGINQDQLRENIRLGVDNVWLPTRRIGFSSDESPDNFSTNLLGDLTPEILIYLHESDPNFLFQLSSDVWNNLSDETVEVVLAYLASQTQASTQDESPLRRTLNLDIIPQIQNLDIVASVSISGGQTLPNENNDSPIETVVDADPQMTSILLELSPEVWEVVSAKVEGLDTLDNNAVSQLSVVDFTIPIDAPALPTSWQMDRFVDTTDLIEMETDTRTLALVFDNLVESGEIVGSLGQTNDLTPEIVTQMLAIAPSMVLHFGPEHLAAMSGDVFSALPIDYIEGLDGFARDELAATSIAGSVTGVDIEPEPVDLPDAWRISPPQIITFSFGDLPLATFSVSGTGIAAIVNTDSPSETNTLDTTNTEDVVSPTPVPENIPEGPALPQLFTFMGEQLGIELNTADDLIEIELPEDFAELTGGEALQASDFFSFLTLLSDPTALEGTGIGFDIESLDIAALLPALQECNINALALAGGNFNFAEGLIGCVSADAIAFLVEYDPNFASNLQVEVFGYFSDEVLLVQGITPPLPGAWDTLVQQPQFATMPLNTLDDLINLNGHASDVLNTINANVPEQFSGYEVRLFSSLSPTHLRYFTLHEDDFYLNLDEAVLRKLSSEALSSISDDVFDGLNTELVSDLRAIANGDQTSALDALSSLYTTDIPPADPDAPQLNEEWLRLANFYGIELDTADDFFRFPTDFQFSTPAELMNSVFDTAQGVSFAPDLFGGVSVEVVDYMLERDSTVFDDLGVNALRQFPDDVLATLPDALQERVAEGGESFEPTNTVTRTNGQASFQLTILKTSEANTVTAFHEVEELLAEIDETNEDIEINVVFEQASFIEESVDGVAREGGLGGVFAIVMILLFMSGGIWTGSSRRTTGIALIVLSVILLAVLTVLNLDAVDGDFIQAFTQMNIVIQMPLLLVLLSGLLFAFWPGQLPRPAWRSTLVTAVSIPLSVLIAFALMYWLSPAVNAWLQPYADVSFVRIILRLFPESITLNIMTLSGLTVAIGRVVDDSIVVLENIFRELQNEETDKIEAIIAGTRDVSVAIFAATVITVVVFIPLGLTGGIIGELFLPFGLAVTYSLIASFVVAITVVPVLVYLIVRREDIHQDEEEGALERLYLPILHWSLSSNMNRFIVLAMAAVTMILGLMLFGSRPAAFLPDFGEPQISIAINMPAGTDIVETNALAVQMETYIEENIPQEDIAAVETIVGGGGLSLESLIGLESSVSGNQAIITIGMESQENMETFTQQIRNEAEQIFGEGNVSVSAVSVISQGFGAFSLVLSGPQDDLQSINDVAIEILNDVEGLTNVSSSLSQVGGASSDGPIIYLRVDGETAVSFTGEIETEDTMNVIQVAKDALLSMPDLSDAINISEGFETEVQTEGFANLLLAMGIAIAIIVVILMVTFRSAVHWLDIILSIAVAPVGAAIALTLTDRVLGISALIGMLMLVGIVVTNAVVLIDRVMSNISERKMNTHDALIEAGGRRLRPILMTAFATIFALLPLAIGLSEGAIIASELGTVVIGGLFSSTLLTLIVVPVAYSLLDPLHRRIGAAMGRKSDN